jgi:hypothetical protein
MSSKTTPVKFMSTWLQQMNYPKISIDIKQDAARNRSIAVFNQKRFLLTETKDTNDSPFKYYTDVTHSFNSI